MSKYAPIDMEALARTTLQQMDKIARLAYPPVQIVECWMCHGLGRDEDGTRCYNCAGKGSVATDPEFEI